MKQHLHARLSPSLAVSVLALFVALGGSGYAATSRSQSITPLHYTNATLINGWNYGGFATFHAGYAKDPNGVVHLRGSLVNGASNNAAFILPVADRPSANLYFTIYTFNGLSQGSVKVETNGFVTPFGAKVSNYSSLDGLTFSTK
jgi:hypothetical protein